MNKWKRDTAAVSRKIPLPGTYKKIKVSANFADTFCFEGLLAFQRNDLFFACADVGKRQFTFGKFFAHVIDKTNIEVVGSTVTEKPEPFQGGDFAAFDTQYFDLFFIRTDVGGLAHLSRSLCACSQ